ncbi:MAG: GNAT family N-acetyltransferase [Bacteroidetes bacterium]|nr:GNAT family N-acetyltransferase [Bacteroidota bacterium]HET6242908.1 GNAT family N-acetyltransferase [Bacteroidia bacterium]
MSFITREANVKDFSPITELSTQLGYDSTSGKIKNRLKDILRNKDHCVFVVEDGDKIVGWIHAFYSLRIESDSFLEIGGMVVDASHRGKGLGKMLIKKAEEFCSLKKLKKIRVRCNTIRKQTHGFYEKLGFSEIKEQKIFDKNLDFDLDQF